MKFLISYLSQQIFHFSTSLSFPLRTVFPQTSITRRAPYYSSVSCKVYGTRPFARGHETIGNQSTTVLQGVGNRTYFQSLAPDTFAAGDWDSYCTLSFPPFPSKTLWAALTRRQKLHYAGTTLPLWARTFQRVPFHTLQYSTFLSLSANIKHSNTRPISHTAYHRFLKCSLYKPAPKLSTVIPHSCSPHCLCRQTL